MVSEGPVTKRRRRKRQPVDPAAPKRPDSGYIRFLKERRDGLVADDAWAGPASIAAIAGEWSGLQADKKDVYLKAAAADKLVWDEAMAAHCRSDAHKEFLRSLREADAAAQSPAPVVAAALRPSDIPIFSPAFLEASRERESALRASSARLGQLEEEAAALERRQLQLPPAIAGLKDGAKRLRTAAAELTNARNAARKDLVAALAGIKNPGSGKAPTLDTLDDFLKAAATTSEKTFRDAVHKALFSLEFSV